MMNHTMFRVQNATYSMERFLFNMLGDVMQQAQKVPEMNNYAMLIIILLIMLIFILQLVRKCLPQRTHATERDSPQHNATQLPM